MPLELPYSGRSAPGDWDTYLNAAMVVYGLRAAADVPVSEIVGFLRKWEVKLRQVRTFFGKNWMIVASFLTGCRPLLTSWGVT